MPKVEDATWLVFFYVGISLFLFSVQIISIASGSFQFFWRSPRRLLSGLKSLWPKWSPAHSNIPDPAALHKAKIIEAALVKRGRTTFWIFSSLLTLVIGRLLVRLVRYGPLDTSSGSYNLFQTLLLLVVYSLSTVVVVRPSFLRAGTLPYVYIFSMFCVILWGTFTSDCVGFFIRTAHAQFLSVILGFMWMHFPLIMFMNIFGILLQTTMYAQLFPNNATCIDIWDLTEFVGSQIFRLILILLTAWVACQYTEQSVEWEIDKRSDKCLRIGFLSLLKSMCDVTVELDSTARLVEHSPALTHMILQRDGNSLRGLTLDRWFKSATELATFKELTRNAILEDGQPRTTAMHCDLRSDLGVRIPVQMHIVHFQQIDGTVHHLLGIKEEPEFESIRPLPDITGRSNVLHPLPDIVGRSSSSTSISPGNSNKRYASSELPSNSISSSESSTISEGGQKEFEFHPTEDFQIIDASSEFGAMCHNSRLGVRYLDKKSFASHLAKWITHESTKVFKKEPELWSKDMKMNVSNISSKIVAELAEIPANTDSVALEVFTDLDVLHMNFLPQRRSRMKHTICIYLQIRGPKCTPI